MTDLYKFASQNKLRFPSSRGMLCVEQLFDLPLKSERSDFDLNTVAKNIAKELQGATEENYVEDRSADPRKTSLAVAFDVVKDIIATKQAENRATMDKAKKRAEREQLDDLIHAKKSEKLAQTPLEELEARRAALVD